MFFPTVGARYGVGCIANRKRLQDFTVHWIRFHGAFYCPKLFAK